MGKALAETLLERLGAQVADGLSEAAKFDAERREEIRQFQEDVETRARKQMYEAKDEL